jgi:hypothetical protein
MVALNQIRIPSRGPGKDQLQPMLSAAAQPHKPLLRSSRGLLFRTVRVGLRDSGVQQGLQPAERHRTQ